MGKTKNKEKYSKEEEVQMAKKNKIHRKKSVSESSEDEDYSFTPMLERHSCTDIICTILFIISILLLAFVSAFAYMSGNPASLIKPHDSEGNICGETPGLENKTNLFFFDITRCLSVVQSISLGCPTKQICVDKCPSETSTTLSKVQAFCDPKNKTNCPTYILSSTPLFGRCVPKIISTFTDAIKDDLINSDNSNNTIQVNLGNGSIPLTLGTLFESAKYLKNILDLKALAQTVYEDLSKSYVFILLALGAGALIAFIWMFLLRFLIKPMIFISLISVICITAYSTYFCVTEYLFLKQNSTESNEQIKIEKLYDFDYLTSLKETWLAFSIISGVLFLVLFLIIIFLRKRIAIAAELIKETSKAITCIPSALVWPLFPFLLQLGVIVYCASIGIFLIIN